MIDRDPDHLSDRKKAILRAVVDAYIASGEPVGSKYLTQLNEIRYSSATVRNEMAELENMGYLEQPHASAGRVPSEQGYRFYVDALMEGYRMTSNELRQLNSLVRSKAAELDSILDRAGKLMSVFTNYTSLTAKPRDHATRIRRYKVMRVDDSSFLLIMVTLADTVITKHIHTTDGVDDDGLVLLEETLNRFAVMVSADELKLPVLLEIQTRMAGYEPAVTSALKCIYEALNQSSDGDVRFEGINRFLQYPEFSNPQTLSGLLGLPEHKNDILELLSAADPGQVQVYIGNENTVDSMRQSALVLKTITNGDRVIGALGVIGPCRMDYSKVITALEYLSGNITSLFAGDTDDGKPNRIEGKEKDQN